MTSLPPLSSPNFNPAAAPSQPPKSNAPPEDSVIAVTTADAAHFDMAANLLDCLRSHPALAFLKLGLLDVGLTPTQRESLLNDGVAVTSARWEFDGNSPAGMPTGQLSMLSRPFLPKYFPGFQTLVSLDSDTWIQIPSAIHDLITGASLADIAIAPELHPTYPHLYNPNHNIRKTHRGSFTTIYGHQLPIPADNVILNAGVFAARHDSRLWTAWAASLGAPLARLKNATLPDGKPLFSVRNPIIHFIEQNALNHAYYTKQFTILPMSPLYNFICTLAMPLFDPATAKLVEPSPPYAPIQILHLTGAGREAKSVQGRDGQTHLRSLHWPDWKPAIAPASSM